MLFLKIIIKHIEIVTKKGKQLHNIWQGCGLSWVFGESDRKTELGGKLQQKLQKVHWQILLVCFNNIDRGALVFIFRNMLQTILSSDMFI